MSRVEPSRVVSGRVPCVNRIVCWVIMIMMIVMIMRIIRIMMVMMSLTIVMSMMSMMIMMNEWMNVGLGQVGHSVEWMAFH